MENIRFFVCCLCVYTYKLVSGEKEPSTKGDVFLTNYYIKLSTREKIRQKMEQKSDRQDERGQIDPSGKQKE